MAIAKTEATARMKPAPFSPEQDLWITTQIEAALAREKGYVERVGKITKSIVIWIGALLAGGGGYRLFGIECSCCQFKLEIR